MTSDLLALLRCPRSGQPLVRQEDHLLSPDGRYSYPVVAGIPILIDADASIFSVEDVAASALRPERRLSLVRRLARSIPSSSENIASGRNYRALLDLVRQRANPNRPRILIVGGGEIGSGMSPLIEAEDVDLVETDVYIGPRVKVVCDGHHLPFCDAAFDGVVVQAVLEHVLDPSQVVSEIHRVLRPNGAVYAETPFMQQVHEGPFDFTRFTDLGHRRLFSAFAEVDRGVALGPATALLWSIRYFARSLPSNSSRLVTVFDKLATLCLFWMKYLDIYLAHHPGAADSASGYFFLGTRSDQVLPDREILAQYRGTFRSPVNQRLRQEQLEP